MPLSIVAFSRFNMTNRLVAYETFCSFHHSAFDSQEATQTALKLCQRGILRYLIVQFTDELSRRKN